MKTKVGSRWRSVVCSTEIIVIRAPADTELRCGGAPMIEQGTEGASDAAIAPARSGGSLLGKRYADDDLGVEVLVTRAGDGTLAVGDSVLSIKEAKALPASD